ncbi:hypothetical protein IGI04_015805, partial [Brassica rapa subsp. trilocularis]
MDLRGWDPGDQRVTRDNQRVDLHHYEGSWRGLKQTGVSTRRDRVNFGGNLRINGNIWRARSLESVKALGSLRLRKSSSNIIQRRDLCSTIVVLIKTKSQDLGVLLLKGCQKDTPQSFITRRWKSQLIGSAMSVERNPKRLKISGPHFDNTGLIDEVQFDFEEEEDIDEVQVGWRGSYYEAHVKRIDGSFSNQEESGFGFFGERKIFHVGVDGFAYILHVFGGSKSYSFYFIYGSRVISLWRLRGRIWIMLAVSFPIIMEWSRPQRTVNNWSVEIGYHYTHRLSSQEQFKMFFKC